MLTRRTPVCPTVGLQHMCGWFIECVAHFAHVCAPLDSPPCHYSTLCPLPFTIACCLSCQHASPPTRLSNPTRHAARCPLPLSSPTSLAAAALVHGTPLQHAHACPKANHPSLTSSLLLPSLLNSPQLSKDVAAASFDIQTTGITGSLGHCTSADASKPVTCALKVAGLPVGTMVYHGIPFPIKAGALTGIPQLDITLPASLPSFASATTTTLKVTAANGDQVMCVEVFTKAASTATDTMKALRGPTQIA